jgi:two-component sensor histidine kinase
LFFGHASVGVFAPRHEQLLIGIAAQASVGIDNARLFTDAQRELKERRTAEKHRQLLINELNHRVKNTLATVQSIVAQTMRKSKVATDLRVALDARLIALAQVHDLLTRESWEGTSLRDVVELAIQPYRTEGEDAFTIAGPSIRLAPKTALAVAMALHELVTNALRHGALSNPGGRVNIHWRTPTEGDAQRMYVSWSEHNGPQVAGPVRRGFGSRMIESALAAELNGMVRLEFRPTGLVCEIDAPLPRLAEQRSES